MSAVHRLYGLILMLAASVVAYDDDDDGDADKTIKFNSLEKMWCTAQTPINFKIKQVIIKRNF